MTVYRIRLLYEPDPRGAAAYCFNNSVEEEIVEVSATTLDEARIRSMFYNKIQPEGRIVRKFDEEGNELFANAG